MILTAVIILILVAIDRATKLLAITFLAGKGTVEVIPKFIGLYLLEGGNTGAAFGMFNGKTIILSVVTFVVIVAMLYVLFLKKFTSKLLKTAVIMITAGGIGNLYDRVVYGYVTDFLRFLFFEFPIFNFADSLVSVGACLVVLYIIIAPKDEPIFVKPIDAKTVVKEENDE